MKIFAPELQAARAVGQAYLRDIPRESNAFLDMIVKSGTDLMRHFDVLSKKNLIAKLRKTITEDFVSPNTVQEDGWVLSRTEAGLCALCTLL